MAVYTVLVELILNFMIKHPNELEEILPLILDELEKDKEGIIELAKKSDAGICL